MSSNAARAIACPVCGWRYLFPPTGALPRCPHCYRADLTLLADNAAALPYVRPLELVIPFRSLVDTRIEASLKRFFRAVPYPPQDLTVDNLRARLQKVFVPAWLVDVQVVADWRGETGFAVTTRSHVDKYSPSGGWSTMEVERTMLRWELRAGHLERTYHNLRVPAMRFEPRLRNVLGQWSLDHAVPCTGALLADAFIGLPERLPDEAWDDVGPLAHAAAAQECAAAAGGNQMRDFQWVPQYLDRNWTLLLQPIYTTFYRDDEGQPHVLMFNGETGIMTGARRGSFATARQVSQSVIIYASIIIIFGLLLLLWSLFEPQMLTWAFVVIGCGVLVGLWGLTPLLMVKMSHRRGPHTGFHINNTSQPSELEEDQE